MDVFFTRHSFIYLIILIVVGCDAPLEEGNSLPINSLNTSLIEDYGLSPNNDDHDGDGLLNQWEITYSGNYYNPALKDTTDNGIEDNREDYDNDGLDSLAEQGAGTSPFLSDTDGDNLNDDREIELGTNPNLIDTDGDGIPDGVEVGAALDPLSVATDGQLDAEKSINNTIAIVDGSTLSIRGVYNPEPGIRLSVEVGDETTGLENGDKIYRVLLTEDTGLESDSLTISIPFIAETSEELLIQFYSPELGWSNLPDNVSINVDLENKMAEITLSADQFTSLFSSNSENVIQQKNNRALAQKTAGYISTIPAMFTVRNLENAFLAISKFVNKPDVTPDFYYDFSSSESKNVTINDSELTYVDSTIYPDSQAVILDGETSIDLALSNAPIIEDYTINIYLEDISKPGVLLKNSAENGTSYNYLYIQTAKNDISTITYIKKGQELITYINGLEEQRIQGNDNNSILPLNHNINIGTPIFGCSFDIDLSHCDFNTPINGIVNRVEIFSQVMEPESIRAHLSDYYTNRFGETDTDLDKITDAEEIVGILLIDGAVNFTNRLIADSDEDGIIDGDEVSRLYPFELSIANKNNVALKAAFKFGNSTCPLLYSFCLPSFDYSFSTPILFSKNTYRVSKTSPTTKDTDQDGLSDIDEYDIGTSPIIKDSDSDGIIDGDELYIDTDPTMFDTDGDGLGDGLEHYATALELDPTFPDDLTFEFDENKYQLLKKYVAANYTLNSPEGWDKVKNFFLFSYASIAQEFNETANQNIYTNKIINNSELAAFHNYFKLSGVDKDYFQNKASEIAERINHKKTAHIIVGLLKGFDLGEPENQYELAGQFLNIPIYFIPGVEIPFTVRDILGLTYQARV